jgi:acetyl esterase/lipase
MKLKDVFFPFVLALALISCKEIDNQQMQTAETYTVTAATSPAEGGTVTRNPNQQYHAAGTQITVTATANSGHTFSSWTGTPLGVNASSASITFNINSNVDLTANFQSGGTMPIVRQRLNVDYAPNGTRRHARQRYDLRLPDTGEGPFPLVMYVHGGAFIAGNWQLSSNNNGLVSLARSRGYAVASIGYLLTSSSQKAFPELVEDVLAAIRHLRANAAEYRLDPDRFAITGFSAGGWLTAIICAVSGTENHGYDVTSLGNIGVSHKVQAAASSAALTDFMQLNAQQQTLGGFWMMPNHYISGGSLSQLFGGGEVTTARYGDALAKSNPLTYINPNTPPIYMLHGTNDNLVPWLQSEIMVNKINEFVPDKAIFNKVTGRGHADFDGTTNATTIAILDFLDQKLNIQR